MLVESRSTSSELTHHTGRQNKRRERGMFHLTDSLFVCTFFLQFMPAVRLCDAGLPVRRSKGIEHTDIIILQFYCQPRGVTSQHRRTQGQVAKVYVLIAALNSETG